MPKKTAPLVRPTIDATRKTLKEPRLEDHALQMRQTRRDLEFQDATGVIVRSVELPSHGPFLITLLSEKFVHLPQPLSCGLTERNREIRAGGVTLLAISPQTPDHSLTFQEENRLDVSVLSDAGSTVAR